MTSIFRLFFTLVILLQTLAFSLSSDEVVESQQSSSVPTPTPSVPEHAPSPIQGEEQATPKPVSLVNETSAPSALVNGSVNIITGDFIASGADYIVSGPDGYHLGHNYTSSLKKLKKSNLGYGWSLQHSDRVLVFQPSGINYTKHIPVPSAIEKRRGLTRVKSDYSHLYLSESHGGKILFKGNGWAEHFRPVIKKTGYTNTNGQSNLKNTILTWDSATDQWTARLGDGTKRIYARRYRQKHNQRQGEFNYHYRVYHIIEEKRPSGNRLIFKYDENKRLIKVKTVNNERTRVLSWVKFNYIESQDDEKTSQIKVETSDGESFTYEQRDIRGIKKKEMTSVTKITHEGHPSQNFYYSEPNEDHERRIKKIWYSNGNFLETKYYRNGSNVIDGKLHEGNDKLIKFRRGRVREQTSPVGTCGDPVVTHSFLYYYKKDSRYSTNVIDHNGTSARYYYDTNKRLILIVKEKNKKLLSKEEFIWGDKRSYSKGFLLCRKLFDENSKAVFAKAYKYDSKGNVRKETSFGNFTGKTKGEILFDEEGLPKKDSPCDVIVNKRYYSNDSYNLKITDEDTYGNKTFYRYKPHTNLLTAKFTCEIENIKRREFFTYDENAILLEAIVDDGSSEDISDLTNVTERKISRIIPRLIHPHFGEPEKITELYLDLKTQKEVTLSSTKNVFNEKGLVTTKELYDSKEILISKAKYSYDDLGRVISSIDAEGREESFEYDRFNHIIKKTLPGGKLAINYTYDIVGRLVKEEEEHKSGLRRSIKHEYDFLNRKTATVDPQGHKTVIKYDGLNRVTCVNSPEFDDGTGNFIQPKRHFTYQNYGRTVTDCDEIGNETTRKYNVEGKLLEESYSDGRRLFYFYNLKGYLEKVIHPNDAYTTYEYDLFGNKKSEHFYYKEKLYSSKSYEHNTFHLLSDTSPTGEVTSYKYDGAGRLISSQLISSDKIKGKKTYKKYDDLNRVTEEWDSEVSKNYEYDRLSRIIQEKAVDKQGNVLNYKEIKYDIEGNVFKTSSSVDGKLSTTTTYYHPGGIPEKIVDAEGNTTLFEIDHFYKSKNGQLVVKKKTTFPNGVISEDIFNSRGLLASSKSFEPYEKLTISKRKFIYDIRGNLISTIETPIEQESKKSKNEVRTDFIYNLSNQFTALIESVGTKEEKKTSYSYNAIGQRNSITYADGSIIALSYDERGRVRRQAEKSIAKTIDYEYHYDKSDRLLSAINKITNAGTYRKYNSFGLLSEETLETGLTIGYSYDINCQVTSINLPDQSKIGYSYNAYQLKSVSKISPSGDELYKHEILKRDKSSNIITQKLALEAGNLTSHYDKLERVISRSHTHFKESGTVYDPVGNLVNIDVGDPIGKKTHSFSYDFLNQLTKEDGVKSHTFTYDSINNRLSEDGTSYKINTLNEVLKVGASSYSYDANGRRTQKTEGLNKTTYSYDVFDRLTSLDINSMHVEYSYDAFNRRTSKRVYSKDKSGLTLQKEERYIYVNDNEIGKVDSTGKIVQLRLLSEGLGAEIGASVAFEFNGKPYVPISDHRGNIVMLLSKGGSVLENYRYSAFGETEVYDSGGNVVEESVVNNPWRFSSKRFDEESGFVYYGRRYYDPSLGKWLTEDPIGLKAGPNLYAFVLNNPMTHIDLYGLIDEATSGESSNGDSSVGSNDIVFNHETSPRTDDVTSDKGSSGFWGRLGGSIASGCNALKNFGKNAAGGIVNGTANFVHGSVQGLHTGLAYASAIVTRVDPATRSAMINGLNQRYLSEREALEKLITDTLSIDRSNGVYQAFRNGTESGLELGTLAVAVCSGAGAGVLVTRMQTQCSKVATGIGRAFTRAGKPDLQKLNRVINNMEKHLGGAPKIIINKNGDMVLMRDNKIIRFDVNNPHGYKPHFHIQRYDPKTKDLYDMGPEHHYYFKWE